MINSTSPSIRAHRIGCRSLLKLPTLIVALATVILAAPCARAQEASFNLTIHDSKFEPSTLQVPAGKKIKISIRNARNKPAEFESHELNREKVIPPGTSAVIYVGPLSAGTYGFFDDFNQSVRGQIVAK